MLADYCSDNVRGCPERPRIVVSYDRATRYGTLLMNTRGSEWARVAARCPY